MENNFVGRNVRLTRNELLHLLGNKLRITGSERRLLKFDDSVLLQLIKLKWEFYGVLTTPDPPRKIVATAPRTSRRDFVRFEDDLATRGTCLSGQLIMFVHLSGFDNSDDGVPPVDGEDSVTYALVRWLTAHPNALIRDDCMRPLVFFTNEHQPWSVEIRRRRQTFGYFIYTWQTCYFLSREKLK